MIAEAARLIGSAPHIVVLTGAGISRDSGLPTFREAQTGLWARYLPEDLATPEAFARQPDVVWRWYAWRREVAARAGAAVIVVNPDADARVPGALHLAGSAAEILPRLVQAAW